MVAAVIRLLAGFAIVAASLWAPISLLSLGSYNSRMNNHIKDADGRHPDDVRNDRAVAGQLVPMSVLNLMAGALAGIGASLFVVNGRLRWPSSGVPMALFIVALCLVEIPGMFIISYLSRPTRDWVTDSSVLRSYLRVVNARGWVGNGELADIRKLRRGWDTKTSARPLRSPGELAREGLELPAAQAEWSSSVPVDPALFKHSLCSQVNPRQIRGWIKQRRIFRLGASPLISGLAVAAILRGLIDLIGVPIWLSISLLFPLAVGCAVPLYWWGFCVARKELVVVNRLLALERAQLRDCDVLLAEIESWKVQEHNGLRSADAEGCVGRLMLRIGRWDVLRRNDAHPGLIRNA